jgi:hypothetical protein
MAFAGRSFLDRLHVAGEFDVPSEMLTKPGIEQSISAFSQRMENNRAHRNSNKPPDRNPDVFSSLQGPVSISSGIASSPHLLFRVPGASVTLHGTYSFRDRRVHLTGMLVMAAGISHATTGWKSALLALVSPFFRRKHHPGSKIRIAVVGKPGHYHITHDQK